MKSRIALIAVCTIGVLVFSANAGEPNPDRAVYDGLRDVINHGARVFNEQGDYHGCARVFQGGLLAVRPLLAHRPELQKAIDEGLARAEGLPRVIDRAFALRQVLDELRERTRAPAAESKVKEKPPAEKLPLPKTPEKMQAEKKAAPEKTVAKKEEKKLPPGLEASATVHGEVTLNGQPLATGYVTFVEKTSKRGYSTYLRADGTYHFRHPLMPGSYSVSFGPAPTEPGVKPQPFNVPAPFRSPATSPVVAEVRAGENVFDFNLKK